MTTVNAVLENPIKDQKVQLRGRVIERKKENIYLFTDETAEILIEIDEQQ